MNSEEEVAAAVTLCIFTFCGHRGSQGDMNWNSTRHLRTNFVENK